MYVTREGIFTANEDTYTQHAWDGKFKREEKKVQWNFSLDAIVRENGT